MSSDLINHAVDALNAKLAGGGLEKSISLRIKDEGAILIDADGAHNSDADADCVLKASAKTFQGLMDGSVNPMTAVMLGKLKLSGDMSVALKLGSILG